MFDSLSQVIVDHALAEFPKEACGLVVAGERYVPCANVAADPVKNFEVDPLALIEWRDRILAIVHSHTDGSDYPSADDMTSQMQWNLPFGLVSVEKDRALCKPWYWGDGCIPDQPLLGRKFRHGPTGTDFAGDCYALIRDHYRPKGLVLPEFARDHLWWSNGGDLYVDNFEKVGFQQIKAKEMVEGCAFLTKIRSKKINHGGVYLGRGLIMHHIVTRKSVIEPAGLWAGTNAIWLKPPEMPS